MSNENAPPAKDKSFFDRAWELVEDEPLEETAAEAALRLGSALVYALLALVEAVDDLDPRYH